MTASESRIPIDCVCVYEREREAALEDADCSHKPRSVYRWLGMCSA